MIRTKIVFVKHAVQTTRPRPFESCNTFRKRYEFSSINSNIKNCIVPATVTADIHSFQTSLSKQLVNVRLKKKFLYKLYFKLGTEQALTNRSKCKQKYFFSIQIDKRYKNKWFFFFR